MNKLDLMGFTEAFISRLTEDERKILKMRYSKVSPVISPETRSYSDEPFISKAIGAYSEELARRVSGDDIDMFHDLNARMTDESRRLMIDYIHQNPLKPFSDWISKARDLLSTQESISDGEGPLTEELYQDARVHSNELPESD